MPKCPTFGLIRLLENDLWRWLFDDDLSMIILIRLVRGRQSLIERCPTAIFLFRLSTSVQIAEPRFNKAIPKPVDW